MSNTTMNKFNNIFNTKKEEQRNEKEVLRKEIIDELKTEITPIHTENKEFDVLSTNIKKQVSERLKYFDKINNFLKNAENIEEPKKNKIFKLMNQIN